MTIASTPITSRLEESEIILLHRHLLNNLERIGKEVVSRRVPKSITTEGISDTPAKKSTFVNLQ